MRTAAIIAAPDVREQVLPNFPRILTVAPEPRIALRASNDTVAELRVYLAE